MLDINLYRHEEETARNNIIHWRVSQKYNLDIFMSEGFPVRLNNFQQLRQIFDTMQEGHFETVMQLEQKGFTEEDIDLLTDALVEIIEFQYALFPKKEVIFPLDTILSQFSMLMKVRGLAPNVKNILEFGPGVGMQMFMLKKLLPQLNSYTYTDACESFYILQSLIANYCFKGKFNENVIEKEKSSVFVNENDTFYSKEQVNILSKLDEKYKKDFSCTAYPWWKLNDLYSSENKYDLILSNANLLEFSEGSLDDYLEIMNRKLSDDGMIFSQCVGYSKFRDLQYLIEKLKKNKLAVLFFGGGQANYTMDGIENSKVLTHSNLLLIGEKHPLFSKYYERNDFQQYMLSDIEDIDKVFLPHPKEYENKKILSKKEIINKVLAKLKI